MAERERPRSTELWERLLEVFDEHLNVVVWGHPLDRALAIRHLQNLHRVGERPDYEELKAYLDKLWPHAQAARRAVRNIWRTILDDPYHRFRVKPRRGDVSLATLDRLATQLAREYGSPPLEWRVLDVLADAYERFARVTIDDPDFEAYLSARRDLTTAMHTLGRVRELRHGYQSTGNWFVAGPDQVPREKAARWRALQRRYTQRVY
jgi:hypothetical protein